ncbi:MAG TPA: LamB/YcsF family protein, partial [Rudaea sp.]|nr:LamB/YcsF family protein [Rudaea sp.]
RREAGAVIHDLDAAVAQAVQIATNGKVETRDGKIIDVRADTICVHGDRDDAAMFARRLREALNRAGARVVSAT